VRAIAKVARCMDSGDTATAEALHEDVRRFRRTVEGHGPIPAQKRLLAIARGDARWANVRPPLQAMPEPAGQELAGELRREFAGLEY